MATKKTTLPFAGTKEQEQTLRLELIALKHQRGALMPSLQKAQGIYGYLPVEVQTIIAKELNISLEDVYSVATFYSQFSLEPKGKYQVSVCVGTACYVKGAGDLHDKLKELLKIEGGQCTEDGKYSLEGCRCIGACGLAPVLMVNEDVYGRIGVGEVEAILAKYK